MGRYHLENQIRALKKRIDETEDKSTRRTLMDRHDNLLLKLKAMPTVEQGTLFQLCGWCDETAHNCQCRQH